MSSGLKYANGQIAFSFLEDGSGFSYYKTGARRDARARRGTYVVVGVECARHERVLGMRVDDAHIALAGRRIRGSHHLKRARGRGLSHAAVSFSALSWRSTSANTVVSCAPDTP